MLENVLPTTDLSFRLAVGFASAITASLIALRLNVLSPSGALAAVVVGTAAVGAGWTFALLLVGFFVSSTALSRYRRTTKEKILSGIVAKGNARDAVQVFANGGVFAAASLWFTVAPNPTAMALAAGAIAAATSDTWATEIGSLSSSTPRSILSGRQVPAGTSGGITLLGAAAGFAGATFVGIMTAIAAMPGLLLTCAIAGVAGAAADSWFGALVQSRRWCARCESFTEREIHTCGTLTTHASGVRWINNDMVNLFCTLVGALLAALWVL